MLYTPMKTDYYHEDDRGNLVQLFHDGWRQANLVFSKKGTVRGGHYHKENREAFYIISGMYEADLVLNGEQQTHVFKTGDFFAIEPNTVHTFRYLENTLLLGFYDLGVEKMSGGGYSISSVCRNNSRLQRFAEVRRTAC